jgi:hypothetical protein
VKSNLRDRLPDNIRLLQAPQKSFEKLHYAFIIKDVQTGITVISS